MTKHMQLPESVKAPPSDVLPYLILQDRLVTQFLYGDAFGLGDAATILRNACTPFLSHADCFLLEFTCKVMVEIRCGCSIQP
jgi:hypothetical protein